MACLVLHTMTDDAPGGGGDDGCGNGDDGFPLAGPDVPREVEGESIHLDTLFDLMSKERCRRTFTTLDEIPANVVELADLVDHVVEREGEAGVGDGSENHRQRVAVALHHRFLPKLSNAAIVDYDARSKTVRYWGNDRALAYLDLFGDEDGE